MENEGRAQPEAQYQRELEGVRNDVAHLTSMLEQILRARDGEGTSTQPNEAPAAAQIPVAPINIGANTPTKQSPARPIQIPITLDLTNEDPHDFKFSNHEGDDKWTALEERLRAIEGSDLFDPIRAAEVCLVPNIVIPKKFRVPEFVKYTGMECPKTHLRSYYNKMAEVIHDDKMKWTDLADAFLKQYKFNLEIAPDRTSLISMEKGTQESVRAYAQRWRDQAINVQPPLIETEMVTLFANTFRAPYYEHLMGSSAQHFYDVVRIAERIEQGIRSGRIAEPLEKRGFIGRKKEIEIAPLPIPPMQPPFPAWYNPEVTCEYHAGHAGHSIEACFAFKRKVLQLIKVGWVTFEDSPNQNSNPLPKHVDGRGGVNTMEIGSKKRVLKVTMAKLYLMLVQSEHLEETTEYCTRKSNFCLFHKKEGHHIDECIEFHQKVARMLTLGELRIEDVSNNEEVEMIEKCRIQSTTNGRSKLVLTRPSYASKVNYGGMPEDYGYTSNIETPLPLFRTEISGLTRSGRCFTPEELERQRKAKGKEVLDLDKEFEVNKPVTEEETNEFLKLMKHSEYSIVDQLKKTPAKISIMSLILSSEPHRNALQKVLNEAYVPQDIEQKTMEHLVGRIHAANYLYFTEDELDAEGTGHNKPLYVTVRCKDCLVGKVLIDNGSALNVLPRHMLDEMPIDPSHMQPSVITARAYDGSSRPVVGSIEVELAVGPQVFLVTLQVMDIYPSYSMLLGRPWIHSAGAVTSSLHQCLKYIANGVLVTVKAEETISMVRNVAVPFIEAEDCKDGNLHAFEVVNTEWVPENTVQGRPEWMGIIKLKAAEQRFGLGYKPKKEDYKRAAGARREKRMARIEGRKPEEENLAIPPSGLHFQRPPMNPESGSSTTTPALYIENEWPKFKEYIVAVEDEEWEEENIWEFKKINRTTRTGNEEIKRELKIGTLITPEAKEELIALLKDYVDVFAWSYEDMPGLDTDIVVHRIPLMEGCKPIKQKLRRTHPEVLIKEEKSDWWVMYFDGAVNVCGNGAGAVIISPDKKQYPVSVKLQFGCTNNTAEYEACILGLEAALEMNIKKIDVYGDSMLIICQEDTKSRVLLDDVRERLYRLCPEMS
ncbi:uncharacterized protein [Populus alba]|uniref:uncharacterized protein n=1 Tax=Populus alba TaxID=43335 RepID=UPI003CC7360A